MIDTEGVSPNPRTLSRALADQDREEVIWDLPPLPEHRREPAPPAHGGNADVRLFWNRHDYFQT
jgi:hypothetical protein